MGVIAFTSLQRLTRQERLKNSLQLPEGEPHSTLVRFSRIYTATGDRAVFFVLRSNVDTSVSGAVAFRTDHAKQCNRCTSLHASPPLLCTPCPAHSLRKLEHMHWWVYT